MSPALSSLAALFESAAMGERYGEDISIRDHMLQCAELAVNRGMGDALVAAALLHDIGWALGGEHEATGADFIAPILGKAVSEPIRHHVGAKRYLVATDPGYASRLSTMSVQTLRAQGGAMSTEECAAFAANPAFAAAIELRRLDDAGKRLEQPRTNFADYRDLLDRLAHNTSDSPA